VLEEFEEKSMTAYAIKLFDLLVDFSCLVGFEFD